MADYYVAPIGANGSGTVDDPWGIPDLFTASGSAITYRAAMTTLQPGDTLFFRGGTYNISGPVGTQPLISPTHSGTAVNPITLRPYPGESVMVIETPGASPVFGTLQSSIVVNNPSYIRFLGFSISTPNDPGGLSGSGFHMGGVGNEIAYCDFLGHYVNTNDNHPGIRVDYSDAIWIHHNTIHDVISNQALSGNGSGIEMYYSNNCIIEDNYFYNCDYSVYDKITGFQAAPISSGSHNTFRRNWGIFNTRGYEGNGYLPVTTNYIYDNVFDGPTFPVDIGMYSIGSQVYNNLFRMTSTGQVVMCTGNDALGTQSYLSQIWNNISIHGGSAISLALWLRDQTFPSSADTRPYDIVDYNVYDGTPSYFLKISGSAQTISLATMRSTYSYETHAIQDTATNIFVDQVSYVLKGVYPTAGRFGDMVGPRTSSPVGPFNVASPNSVSQIINSSRYGPQAMPLSQATAISGPPYEKLTAGTTKSVSPGRGW